MYASSGGGGGGGGGGCRPNVTSPDSALASEVFDRFCSAVTFKSILSLHRQLCDLLRLKPTHFPQFYPKLKAKLRSWKAQALWSKFDKRAAHRCYNRGKPCANTRVLIIGCGPCGLRTAIEAQLLGAKVVVVEKRDRFSRNNVLHLWPFVIHDLRALGAKKFFGKFCAGSIDHISIRQLQCVLLKVALLLGVEVHENVAFESLIQPPEDQSIRTGWRAKVSPADHPVSQYEFDVLIGADGKRNTLEGFKRKEFRGRLAIAITANLVNRKSEAEARVEEISGVAFIFNQKFFRDLNAATGIDLENIVYYKDETHYFVMTAKKQSLLNKKVIIRDYPDTIKLLSPENVNKEALMEYAREAADFSTNYQLPHMDFAVNHYGQPDVAMFDFTSMFAAENASRVLERRGHKLLMCLVGDSLLEPFWPTGSGCARGWLSSFDACWAIHSWSAGRMTSLEVVAERESIYRLLAQTTPENLNKDYSAYTVEPQTRYPNLNTRVVLDFQVRCYYDTDDMTELERPVKPAIEEGTRKRTKRPDTFIHPDTLLTWLKKQIALYDVTITDVTESFKDGIALCAIIHRYRPDLIDFSSLDPEDVAVNNQLAFDILEELGIPPVTTGFEIAQSAVPDKLAMLSYLTQVHEIFRGEIPCVKQPKRELTESDEDLLGSSGPTKSSSTSIKRASISTYREAAAAVQKQHQAKTPSGTVGRPSSTGTGKRKSLLASSGATGGRSTPTSADRNKSEASLRRARKRRSQDRPASQHNTADRHSRLGNSSRGEGNKPESLSHKVRDFEAKLTGAGNRAADKKPKDLIRAIGKLDKNNDWQLSVLEKKIEENANPGGGPIYRDPHDKKVPKWNRDAFSDKLEAMNRRIHGLPTEPSNNKIADLERGMKQLERKLKEGSVLDTGNRGNNKVSAMAEQLSRKKSQQEQVPPPLHSEEETFRPKPVLNLPPSGGSESCHFCHKRVYLMERMSAEGRFFHRGCFRCEYCAMALRLSGYAFVRDDLLGAVFFCTAHVSMLYYMRNKFLAAGRTDRIDGTTQIVEKPPSPRPPSSTAQETLPTPPLDVIKSPFVQAVVEADRMGRDGTPERVEFENSLTIEATEDEQLSEIDEDEWTDHNFGNSIHSGLSSEDEASSLDSSSDEVEGDEEEDAPGEDMMMELDRPLTADETRRLAESWKKRYSTDIVKTSQSEDELKEEEPEVNGVSIDVPAFPMPPKVERTKEGDGTESSEGTEMGSDEELEMDDEELSEYENVDEEEEEEDESDEEGEEEEDEEEEEASATEIETDSEFDQSTHVDLAQHLAGQGIPTIVVNESEVESLKKSTEQLANGDHDHQGQHKYSSTPSDPRADYVDQYVTLEHARPALQRTVSNENTATAATSSQQPTGRSGVLAYLRRSELLDKSPSQPDVSNNAATAAANALELKKKYLFDYPFGPIGSSTSSLTAQSRSASATNLDNKLKSFVDTISEAQKKLNPAPQPSVPMQVFLQNTANIFQPVPRVTVPSNLPLREVGGKVPIESSMKKEDNDHDINEPPTPTNHRSETSTTTEDASEKVDVAPNGVDVNSEVSIEAPSWTRLNSRELREESLDGDSTPSDSDSEEDGSSESPIVEAVNPYVALPSVVVQDEDESSKVDIPRSDSSLSEAVNCYVNLPTVSGNGDKESSNDSNSDEVQEVAIEKKPPTPTLSIPVQPQLATQEDFDLSPSSEMHKEPPVSVTSATSSEKPASSTVEIPRTPSCQSTITDSELSDWTAADELNVDSPEDLEQNGKPALPTTEPPLSDDEQLVSKSGPRRQLSKKHLDDDFDFADESEAPSVGPNCGGYSKLEDEEEQSKQKSTNQSLDDSPELNDKFVRVRDSIAVTLDKKPSTNTPRVERARDVERRLVLDKKTEPSPGFLRKKEALSQERERQSDVVRDMVMSLIRQQRSSPDKPANRRSGSYGSYGSLLSSASFSSLSPPLVPPSSSSSGRSGSEPPTLVTTPDGPNQRDLFCTPQTSLKPVMEVKSSEEYYTPVSTVHGRTVNDNEAALLAAKRELFAPDLSANFKTPCVKQWEQAQQMHHQSARNEARAKAQAMADRDLGLSPPDYIDNLQDKLRRKTSTEDQDVPPQPPPRSRSFSEPQANDQENVPVAQKQQATAAVVQKPAPLKSAKSVPHMMPGNFSPTPQMQLHNSPRSEVIGSLFLQQQRTSNDSPTWSSPTSAPQSPCSIGSSKSSSYLWAGISPAESQLKLDEATSAPAVSPASASATTVGGPAVTLRPQKKSKDRERRRSIIQTIADLFSTKKDETKEAEAAEAAAAKKAAKEAAKAASPTKFQLLKLSPRKEKAKSKSTSAEDGFESGRLRSSSSPASPPNDVLEGVKPRSSSMQTSPSSGSSEADPLHSLTSDHPSGANHWPAAVSPASGNSSSRRQPSKQVRQAARQAELKRLRMAQSIQRQLEEMEVKQKELEDQGVRLEKSLRGEDGGVGGRDEAALMQEWFQLVHEKNALSRYEQELMVRARELELEDRHARLQQELKDRMSLDETVKSPADVDKEGAILSEMLEIVEQKDSLRSMLEEDRQRYREEDKDLEAQMLAKGLRLATLRQRKESQV